jgi:nucleotide-binding universal stress UspA family protein
MAYRNVLVALDGRAPSRRALEHGLLLVDRDGGRLTILAVEQPPPEFAADVRDDGRVHGAVAAALEAARTAGVAASGLVLEGYPADMIVQFAAERGCDLIVLGGNSHAGTGLGGTADTVVDLAQCGVLVSR